jgi:hypothetical protein
VELGVALEGTAKGLQKRQLALVALEGSNLEDDPGRVRNPRQRNRRDGGGSLFFMDASGDGHHLPEGDLPLDIAEAGDVAHGDDGVAEAAKGKKSLGRVEEMALANDDGSPFPSERAENQPRTASM